MIAWGAEVDMAGDLASAAAVRSCEDGVWRVELVFYQLASDLPDWLEQAYAGDPDSPGVFCDPMPTAPVLDLLRERVWVRTLEAVDVAAASAQFRAAVKARQVEAAHHPALEQAITFAAQRPLAAAFGYERRRVACDMSPLNAAAFGLWGLRQAEAAQDVHVESL